MPYLQFSRHRKKTDYIINYYELYDILEANLELVKEEQIGQSLDFKYGIFTLENLISTNEHQKYDYGLVDGYRFYDFLFFMLSVDSEYGISYKDVEGDTKVALFNPNKIIKVIDVIINNYEQLKSAEADDDEKTSLESLRNMLNEAISEDDLILVMWSY